MIAQEVIEHKKRTNKTIFATAPEEEIRLRIDADDVIFDVGSNGILTRGHWGFLTGGAGPTRLELATSGVTGRRSNQLSYDPITPWI